MGTSVNIANLPFDQITTMCFVLIGLPMFTFWFLMLFGRVVNRYRGYFATAVMLICLVLSVLIFREVWTTGEAHHARWVWLKFNEAKSVSVGISLNKLSSLFLLIVSLVSFLVHLFSIEYLRGDKNFEKYFAYLGLFTYAMFNIVISDNLLQVFVFWEIVGFCSYLLIGFWFENESATKANKKAFLTNRIGDIGFIIGLIVLWAAFGTLDIEALSTIFKYNPDAVIGNGEIGDLWLIVGGIGLFFGCIGKSAQFPLQIWLPNAMEGPTPVSALIHAATMVAAGIYLLAIVFPFLHPDVLTYIAYTGAITAFMGAFAAMAQTDIKRVLAFSTISQLGYMVMAMGAGAYGASLFHLMTHAFFKACLFLCSGAVIHSMHIVMEKMNVHEDAQDMRLMGGMRKRMPVTFVTYTIACAALIGLPFTSGFLSKDEVLASVFLWGREGHFLVPALGFLTVLMTAFYMIRQYIMVFFGELRLTEKCLPCSQERMEAPFLMKVPTIILALLSIFVFFSFNPFHGSWILDNLDVPEHYEGFVGVLDFDMASVGFVPVLSLGLAILGMALAYLIYGKSNRALVNMKQKFFHQESFVYKLSLNNWFLDEVYQVMFVSPVMIFSQGLALFDRFVVDKIVEYSAKVMKGISYLIALFETKVVDAFIQRFGVWNVVSAEVIGWWDTKIIDGIVGVVGKLGLQVGALAKSSQSGKTQSYLLVSLVLLVVLLGLLVVA